MTRSLAAALAAAILPAAIGFASHARAEHGACDIPETTVEQLQTQLSSVVSDGNGGLFKPNSMWSAVVDRRGRLCSVIRVGDAWPGSRAIAIAKASTANDFSNSTLALSTANLYGPTQPSGSLYGLNNSNPFNPALLPQHIGIGYVPGGIITFGGGVALYQGGQVIGGLGVSGDTSCADHAIAYRMRRAAGLGAVPKGVGPDNTDNILYSPTPVVDPATFTHPHCLGTDIIKP
ncbi:MAG: GlcG/HbpS family heme-binding protein [Janthinobacterium lividum]